jgi:hypothetical protein
MQRNNECLIAIILVIILGCAIGYFVAIKEPDPIPVFNEPYKELYDALAKERENMVKEINELKISSEKQGKIIDSLEAVKKQIKYIYVTKVREIDTLNSNGIVNEFKGIFAKSNR